MPDPTPLSILMNCLSAKDAAEQAATTAINANVSAQEAAASAISAINYTPSNASDWADPPPATLTEAVDRLATKIKVLTSTGA